MISKKRGVIFVVLVLFLLVSVSLAEDEVPAEEGDAEIGADVPFGADVPVNNEITRALVKTYNPGYASCGCENDCGWVEDCFYDDAAADGLYCNQCENVEHIAGNKRVGLILEKYSGSFGGNCNAAPDYAINPKSVGQEGCRMVLVDIDDLAGNEDDGAYGDFEVSTIIDQEWNYNKPIKKEIICGWGTSGNLLNTYYNGGIAGLNCARVKAQPGETYICADDQFWHTCTDSQIGSVTWANDYLYNCTRDEITYYPTWLLVDYDSDHDGYTKNIGGDCADNPFREDLDIFECPEVDPDTGEIGCQYPEHSRCAACINPGAPEVCGDNLNNDCDQGTNNLEAQELDDTSDNCDENRWACEQRINPAAETLIQQQDTDSGDDTPGIIIGDIPLPRNIYNERFSWLEINQGEGYCCGYHGLDDLSYTEEAFDGSGEYACLHKENPGLLGYEDDFPDSYCAGSSEWEGSDNWCWVNAVGDAKYDIFSVKSPGEMPFDILSNNRKWIECKEDPQLGPLEIYPPPSTLVDEDIDKSREMSNHFYCYKEGDHYSWAECASDIDKRENKGVKGRYIGEGLFSLPLSKGEETGEEKIAVNIPVNLLKYYPDYYDEMYALSNNFALDFSEYDSLNFMFKFCLDNAEGICEDATAEDLEKAKLLPANLYLKIFASDDQLYFDQSVLGYIINTPFPEKDVWMHVKVPLTADYKSVKSLEIQSYSNNVKIKARNIYLTKQSNEDSNQVQLCSGTESAIEKESSWLTDLDSGEPLIGVNGELLCTKLYGESAWLGKDNEIDSNYPQANCCGDDDDEYYSGKTKTKKGINYGCWNSEPIANEQTTMNVEFSVDYHEYEYLFEYPEVTAKINLEEYYYTCPNDAQGLSVTYGDQPINLINLNLLPGALSYTGGVFGYPDSFSVEGATLTDEEMRVKSCLSYNFCLGQEVYNDDELCYSPTSLGELDFDEGDTCVDIKKEIAENTDTKSCDTLQVEQDTSKTITLGYDNGIYPVIVGDPLIIAKDEFYKAKIESNRDEVYVYFYEPINNVKHHEIQTSDLAYENNTIYIFAEINEEFYTIDSHENDVTKTDNYSYTCSNAECLYPLPGIPDKGITITNPHPQLYELYYLSLNQDNEIEEQLITPGNNQFFKPGNIKARKVAQQVMYISPGEEGEIEDPGYFGCQAGDYLEGTEKVLPLNNLGYCAIKAGRFCAPSVAHQLLGKEQYTTINSWSNESLEKVGYEPIPTEFEEVEDYFENLQLNLKDAEPTISPETRNHTSPVLPAKNFISNAEFRVAGKELPHWQIFEGSIIEQKEQENISKKTHSVGLGNGKKLKSERIAVEQSTLLHLSHNGSANLQYRVYLVDKNGKNETVLEKNVLESTFVNGFSSGDASYLVIEFEGPGTLTSPMLQRLDDLGIAQYNYNHQSYPDGFDPRSGLACCPENYCWNGYACVEPMTELAQMSEHVTLGRDYRCVDGNWKHLPIKWDWNFDQWGFCPLEEQCFVTKEGDPEKLSQEFYSGPDNYPLCVGTEEYIFDHYCEEGDWTSRTKFLATKLIEVAENDDYALYCTDYRQSLPEYESSEDYLGGLAYTESEEKQGLDVAIVETSSPELLHTCFDTILDPEGKRLISDKENTCVNNVCVLRYKEGGKFKSAFATTLNKNITSPDSFLVSLGIPQPELETICTGTGDFIECDLSSSLSNLQGDLWYFPKLNAVIYGKEGISIKKNVFQKITLWFKDLLGLTSNLSGQSNFVTEATNFKELYLLVSGNKQVRAIKEIFPEKKTLVAEFENFDTPVCSYVNVYDQNPPVLELKEELLEILSQIEKLSCNETGSLQRVEVVGQIEGLDFFWPKLTGKLRTNEIN